MISVLFTGDAANHSASKKFVRLGNYSLNLGVQQCNVLHEMVRLDCTLLTVRILRRAHTETDKRHFEGVPRLQGGFLSVENQ